MLQKKKKVQSILTLPRVPARVSSTDAPGPRKLRRGLTVREMDEILREMVCRTEDNWAPRIEPVPQLNRSGGIGEMDLG